MAFIEVPRVKRLQRFKIDSPTCITKFLKLINKVINIKQNNYFYFKLLCIPAVTGYYPKSMYYS